MEDFFQIQINNDNIEKDIFKELDINDEIIEEIFDIKKLYNTLLLNNLEINYIFDINFLRNQCKNYVNIDKVHFKDEYKNSIEIFYQNKINKMKENYNILKQKYLKNL